MLLELIQYLLVRLRWVEFLGGLQGKRWWANLNVNPIEFPFVDVYVRLFSLLLLLLFLALACNQSTLMGRLADRSTYKMNCGKTERREESVKEFFFLNAWIFYWHEKIVIIWVWEREGKKEQQQTNRGWFRLFFLFVSVSSSRRNRGQGRRHRRMKIDICYSQMWNPFFGIFFTLSYQIQFFKVIPSFFVGRFLFTSPSNMYNFAVCFSSALFFLFFFFFLLLLFLLLRIAALKIAPGRKKKSRVTFTSASLLFLFLSLTFEIFPSPITAVAIQTADKVCVCVCVQERERDAEGASERDWLSSSVIRYRMVDWLSLSAAG